MPNEQGRAGNADRSGLGAWRRPADLRLERCAGVADMRRRLAYALTLAVALWMLTTAIGKGDACHWTHLSGTLDAQHATWVCP